MSSHEETTEVFPVDAVDIVRHQTESSYRWLENLARDITHAHANWRPPGTANSIGQTYAHAVLSADVDLNRHFYGREPVIMKWHDRIARHDDSFYGDDVRWDELHAYGLEVERCINELAGALTAQDLERTFDMKDTQGKSMGTWTGIDIWSLHGWKHVRMHGGEIACLKGLQDLEGYPSVSPLYGKSAKL